MQLCGILSGNCAWLVPIFIWVNSFRYYLIRLFANFRLFGIHPLMLFCEFHFHFWEKTNMRRRVGVLFATTAVISIVLVACNICMAEEDDKKAAIKVVLAHELACQNYDFDKLDSLHTADSRGMGESYPEPFEPGGGWPT
jgi:hypothetical protein